jgi:hypothetical protein
VQSNYGGCGFGKGMCSPGSIATGASCYTVLCRLSLMGRFYVKCVETLRGGRRVAKCAGGGLLFLRPHTSISYAESCSPDMHADEVESALVSLVPF